MFQKKKKISKDVLYAAYIGFAIGDALGVPAEFLPRKELLKQPIIDMIGGGFHHREPGVWSDDTALMLANSHSLFMYGFSPRKMAENMVSWMDYGTFSATGEPFGLGNGIRKSLERFKAGFFAYRSRRTKYIRKWKRCSYANPAVSILSVRLQKCQEAEKKLYMIVVLSHTITNYQKSLVIFMSNF